MGHTKVSQTRTHLGEAIGMGANDGQVARLGIGVIQRDILPDMEMADVIVVDGRVRISTNMLAWYSMHLDPEVL